MKSKFHRQSPLFSKRPRYKSIGYARATKNYQISIDDQIKELTNSGCFVVFQETFNSANKKRPQFNAALETLEEGANCLVGAEADNISDALNSKNEIIFSDNLYGDGKSAPSSVEKIINFFS